MILLASYFTRINSGCTSIYIIWGVINGVKSNEFYAMHAGVPRALFQIAKKAALCFFACQKHIFVLCWMVYASVKRITRIQGASQNAAYN
jgi:hypothetical protein